MTYSQQLKLAVVVLFLSFFVGWGVAAVSADSSGGGTTITVTSTLDFAEDDDDFGAVDNYTCTYASGAIFRLPPNGICTLRRAVLEAGVRPDADRPITIEFDIPTNDPNYDSTLNLWEVQIDSSFIWELDRRFISDDGGQVTIDGDSQPGGRTDGPKIMVNTNSDNSAIFGRSLEVRTSNNIIRNLGFHGGGQIIMYENFNLVEDVWMGLTNDGSELKLASTVDSQAMRSMARGGIVVVNTASEAGTNIIQNNRIIGAFGRAISIQGKNNTVTGNFIGMDSDGNVPGGLINCTRGPDYDTSLWYGGEGMRILGSDNIITNNTLAGIHRTQSENDTPAISLEIAGQRNIITDNVIGKDADGDGIGVCGQGLLLQGTDGMVTGNTFFFTRNGFDQGDVNTEQDAAIIMQSFTGRGTEDPARWMKVWDNEVDGGNYPEASYHAYRFASPGVNIEMRKHVPGTIETISGTSVSGLNGEKAFAIDPDTECGGCTVFIYLDDLDDRIESFELIGTGTFNAAGTSWTGTLDRALGVNEGLRTQNMTNDDTTIVFDSVAPIEYYDADTTSRLSDELYRLGGPTAVAVSGQPTAVSGQQIVVVLTLLLIVGSAVVFRPKS